MAPGTSWALDYNNDGSQNNSKLFVIDNDTYVDGYVYGGWSNTRDEDLSGYTLRLEAGASAYAFYGGYTDSNGSGKITNNTVIINGGSANQVYGGYSELVGTIEGNRVEMNNGSAVSLSGGANSYLGTGDVVNNIVNMNGGHVDGELSGGINAGTGDAVGNTVTMHGGTVVLNVTGGASFDGGDAIGNTVSLYGGEVEGDVIGGYGGTNGRAMNNTVNVTGDIVAQQAIGGCSDLGNVSGNTVNITGGILQGFVAGGSSNQGNATNNTVNWSAGTVLESLYGGHTYAATTSGDLRTGNTLNVYGLNLAASNLYNFEKIFFYIPPAATANATMLTLSDPAGTDLRGVTLGAGIAGSSTPLQPGDAVVLLSQAGGPLTTDAVLTNTLSGMQGVSLLYTFSLSQQGNNLIASLPAAPAPSTPAAIRVNPQTKSLSEARLAGLGLLNSGSDLLAGAGMNSVLTATDKNEDWTVFGATGGSALRSNSGSHADMKGASLLTGLVKKIPAASGDLRLGVFFETGYGSYTTHNEFTDAASVAAKGHSEFYGGGLLSRFDVTSTPAQGLYAEASLRAGSAKLTYNTNDLRDIFGNTARYTSQATYTAAHAGLGWIWSFNETMQLDTYAKYFWTRQGSDRVTLSTDDPYNFKAATSSRTRLGARLSGNMTEQIAPYLGVAWDYEFDGKAHATTNGFTIAAPSLRGSTAIAEMGLTWRPAADSAFSFDGGMQVSTGKRESIGGTMQINWAF